MIHTGAVLATWMAGNVAMIIIPNQRKSIAALIAGQQPDPAFGKIGKIRSTHNNYLTLPVLFLMLANHYPIVSLDALRLRHRRADPGGGRDDPALLQHPPPCRRQSVVVLGGRGALHHPRRGRQHDLLAARAGRGWAWRCSTRPAPCCRMAWRRRRTQVVEIVMGRCSMCHAAEPVWAGIAIAPKGVPAGHAGAHRPRRRRRSAPRRC